MTWTIHRLTVSQDEQGTRLDQYIAAAGLDISRSLARKIIDLGGVHINGRRVRNCSLPVGFSDAVEIYIDHLPLEPYRISAADILYQDQYLIVLNKPAQVDTQPTHARYKGTLFEALQVYLKDDFRPHHKVQIGMIQRLDRGTSGIIVFSIHPRSHKAMTRIFLDHQVDKRYLALVHNVPAQQYGEIRSFLARTRKENRVRSVAKGGKEAVTRFVVKEILDGAALVELELVTGRSHQIRAHMAEQGCPLLGDVRYGGQSNFLSFSIQRPLLHACRLSFRHPVTADNLDFAVDLPRDMVLIKNFLGD
ncbi:MAG: RluA family pseudouridine synthase [Desulfuromonadales bacterium]|nr:RluA family pseudouridine synthase [Desulfuromonadales bacterium]MBN2791270.1 RluA family pseudouridine synthase [Desulfuromonadales bacterium]